MARVLVIDDDRALLQALRVGLSAAGHEVLVAYHGEEGLSKVALRRPDVVVLDLGLPDLDGLEVLPPHPPVERGARHRPVGHGTGEPQGGCARRWRQRLRDQAVRHGRARSPDPDGDPRITSRVLREDDDQLVVGPDRSRSRPSGDTSGRGAGRADGQGVRSPGVPGPPRRQGLHAPDDPRQVWGLRTGRRPSTCGSTSTGFAGSSATRTARCSGRRPGSATPSRR